MGTIVGNFFKKASDVVTDIVKTAAVIPNQSYKSITGKDLVKIEYETKLGSTLGGINKVGIDSGHKALMTFANTVTGGYASKLHEKVVPGIVANQKAEFEEKTFTTGVLSKFEDYSEKASGILGTVAGAYALGSGASSVASASGITPSASVMPEVIDQSQRTVLAESPYAGFDLNGSGGSGIVVLALIILGLLIIKKK